MPHPSEDHRPPPLFIQCTRCKQEKPAEDFVNLAGPGEPPRVVCMDCIDSAPCSKCGRI